VAARPAARPVPPDRQPVAVMAPYDPLAASEADLLHKLEGLHRLMQVGAITEAEYAQKKADMLGFLSLNAQVFAALEKLHELKTRGILREDEFEAKKAELLGKLV